MLRQVAGQGSALLVNGSGVTTQPCSVMRTCGTRAHGCFNFAEGCGHTIEVFQYAAILGCISFGRELAMQLVVVVGHMAVLVFNICARFALAQGLIEIVSRFGQSLGIAADTVPAAVVALITDLRSELTAVATALGQVLVTTAAPEVLLLNCLCSHRSGGL